MGRSRGRSPDRRMPWPEGATAPIGHPIQPSVVWTAEDPDALDEVYEGLAAGDAGFVYAREGHPNAAALAARIDALHGAEHGLVTGSGMAAVAVVLFALLSKGDHVVGGEQLYGRSLRLIREELPRMGIETSLADPSDPESVARAIRPETRLILIETVSNPTLRIADLASIARIARETGCLLAVDNTFTTPKAVRPLERGADIVIESVTKLLSGHSDTTLGYVAAATPEVAGRIAGFAQTFGATPSPFDCWLAERGLMTFELRYERASANAAVLAQNLADLPEVRRVIYPGRSDHPDRDLARALVGNRPGNMLSFEIAPSRAAANAFVRALDGRIAFAPTLGDVATTLSHPVSSSHRAVPEADRLALGITEGFFRVSVGCEDVSAVSEAFVAAARAAFGAGTS